MSVGPLARHSAPVLLVLEDGSVFRGRSIGAPGTVFGEAVFNTGMAGYQEVLTDPSYRAQIVAMTAPHVGNYGLNDTDMESDRIQVAGFVVREAARRPSNWRSQRDLRDSLVEAGVVGIEGIDTRRLTRLLRDKGAMRAGLSTEIQDVDALHARVLESPGMAGAELASEVTTSAPYVLEPVGERRFRVVALDFGMKRSMGRFLREQGAEVHVLPASATPDQVRERDPDGLFLTNGPGDPATVTQGIATTAALLGEVPTFGICLGSQLLGHALGGDTYKLDFGHHGVNQPVLRRADGLVEITSHNHGFAVRASTLGEQADAHTFATRDHGRVEVSHVNLNDDVVEGLTARDVPAFSVQYHPEAAPGPTDARYLFARFADLILRKGAYVPKRDDITSVLVLGSGPIVIGQASEFDYSGTQACKVLREEGLRVVLINSNPATIMTDPAMADATYIEPLTVATVRAVIDKERPDALLPTLGGQTALNLAVELYESGVLEEYGVEVLGADLEAIQTAEDRQKFKEAMAEIGLESPRSTYVKEESRAFEAAAAYGYPVVLRPSFTLGGKGGGIAYDEDELRRMIHQGLADSPVHEVLVEESVLGWKEYELEVMRDRNDNCVIVCSIENLDAMGVHTGDSITVAPAMTLSDPEYQQMRDASFAVLRRIGVETGGSNVQFAVDPATGRQLVIEMNPRVSRSSALASKATGFPIAKIAAKLAIGYSLDEIANDITRKTKAAFEPSIDYVVVKVPRFAFEKFGDTDDTLTTKMKSVGEVMAMGRTFKEALNKALRSLEDGQIGFGAGPSLDIDDAELETRLIRPTATRLDAVDEALTRGWSVERISDLTGFDPWFTDQLLQLVERRRELRAHEHLAALPDDLLRMAKSEGFSDAHLARLLATSEDHVRSRRHAAGIRPVFKTVDTCAAEFEAYTPYHYSTYEDEDEVTDSSRDKVIVLGSGPNRIGQGVEFDYCCVHAVFALKDSGYETIMVNCNPETVSTDYDTADRLYFEPLTFEDVLEICHREQPVGVLVQLGGQTPLKLAEQLQAAGVPIWGTSPDAIDAAEDRGRFGALMSDLGVAMPPGGIARSFDEAREIALSIGYPVLVRPSYVLGGRAMQIVYEEAGLERYLREAVQAAPDQPILVDRFLEGAIEIDVDAVFDGHELFVGGVLEHIEEAGVHSGDSACTLPPITLGHRQVEEIRRVTEGIARGLDVLGLLNVQYALKDDVLWCIEANPRASRTVPFVSKATGVPLAKIAARVMAGQTLAALREAALLPAVDAVQGPRPRHIAVKEAVLPFDRFPGVDALLGPEMRSTGEVMGIDHDFGAAFAKSQAGTGTMVLPAPTVEATGTDAAGRRTQVFVSVANRDKRAIVFPVMRLIDLGFEVIATRGTAEVLERVGIPVTVVRKVSDGSSEILDRIESGAVGLVLNTPFGSGTRGDGYAIRQAAVTNGVPCITTLSGILAAVHGVEAVKRGRFAVHSLQDYQAAYRALIAEVAT